MEDSHRVTAFLRKMSNAGRDITSPAVATQAGENHAHLPDREGICYRGWWVSPVDAYSTSVTELEVVPLKFQVRVIVRRPQLIPENLEGAVRIEVIGRIVLPKMLLAKGKNLLIFFVFLVAEVCLSSTAIVLSRRADPQAGGRGLDKKFEIHMWRGESSSYKVL